MSDVKEALDQYHSRRKRGRPKTGDKLSHPEVRSIYIPDEMQFVWSKFQKICKREGRSVSEAIVEYVCNYVIIHDPGNPQNLLTSFAEDGHQTLASIEGRIRQIFLEKAKVDGSVRYREIMLQCRDSNIPLSNISVMINNIEKWLQEKGVKVWK